MATRYNIPMITTLTAARAAGRAVVALKKSGWQVFALQDHFPESARKR